MVCVSIVPTGTSPKARGSGEICNCPAEACVPVPSNGTSMPGPETNTLPPTNPVAAGAKFTSNLTLCRAFRVSGIDGPVTENPLPAADNARRRTCEECALVSTRGSFVLLPSATWPNVMLVGLTFSVSLLTPAPSRPTCNVEPRKLLVNVSRPPVHPVAVGANFTLKVTLAPAARCNGKLTWDRLNSLPLTFIAETVTEVCPPFFSITTCVSV